jgi:hypothetical protein
LTEKNFNSIDPLERLAVIQASTRRQFLGGSGLGLGALALGLLTGERRAAASSPLPAGACAGKPRAKNVIYLHMAGSPSQLELFDYKRELTKWNGKTCPHEFLDGKRFAFIRGIPRMMGPLYKFAQHGQSGQMVSELLPRLAAIADDYSVIRSMHTDQFNHAPAQLLVHTGQARLGYPSLGSWVTYGLGSQNKDLPGFVVLLSGGKTPDGGKSLWGSGFLPSIYQGVQCRASGDPVLYLQSPEGVSRELRRHTLDAIGDLNRLQYNTIGDPETLARISQYELAYRMQLAAPEVMDLRDEPQHVLDLYGAQPGFNSRAEREADPRTFYRGDDPTFANNCLLARRMVEAGVRFVQLYDWGWDHHGSQPGESLDETLPIKAQQIDRAVAGLITDLKQRGLLDETLVRETPIKGYFGRDHHPYAFSTLICGGGVKSGQSYGSSDEIGYYVGDRPVHFRDLHATILHLLGCDAQAFGYSYQGLHQRLIGPTDEARVLTDLLA